MANPTIAEDFVLVDFESDDQDSAASLSLWELVDASDSDDNHHHHSEAGAQSPQPAAVSPIRRRNPVRILDLGFQHRRGFGNDCHDDDVSDGEYDVGEDVDDELMPWSVSDKVGRERMRKLGKRTFGKMQSSKRAVMMVVRPGCVRGKHGLGLKHIN